jgi:molybdate/tungstate transport system substrate-binding protein
VLAILVAACSGGRVEEAKLPLTVFAAASLARPLEGLAQSYERRTSVPLRVEVGGSLEQARKMTELGRVPDVLILVDEEVTAALLPTYLDWYARFATNRLVVAFAPSSKRADSITTDNWWRELARPGARVGRADPALAPAGRYALALMRRAETYYREPGLAERLLARSDQRYVRPYATELGVLLETGEVDYILDYESVARQYGFRFVELPEDLSPAILYTITVPRQATAATTAVGFVTYLLSDAGKRILTEAHISVLPVPVAIGTNVPPEIAERVRTVAAAR